MKFKFNNTTKAYILVFISVIAMANVYVFSKSALNIVHLSQFGFYWFGMAILYNLLLNRKNNNIKILKKNPKKSNKIIVLIGLLELIGTTLFFISIKIMSNPALVSFFANATPVFVAFLGVIVLKERFNSLELLGVFLTISGAFIIAYQPGAEVPKDFYKSLILVLISGVAYSFSIVISKKHIDNISPSVLTINRTIFLFVGSLIFLIFSKQSFLISLEAYSYIVLGSLLGPFLAAFAGYTALKYIEASRSSVLGSSKAMFVLISSYLYFHKTPTEIQIVGGFITIIGVLLISLGKLYSKKKITIKMKS